jgi:hypothetical protein
MRGLFTLRRAHVIAADLETHRAYFPLETMLRILEPKRPEQAP